MTRSMTGFGAARGSADGIELSVEIRSVNSKTCDVKIRLPRDLAHLEPRIQAAIRARIHRGRIDVGVDLADTPDAARQPRINLALARGYLAALRELQQTFALPDTLPVELLWQAPGVIEPPERVVSPALESAVDSVVQAALDGLEIMRGAEGAHLARELGRLTAELGGHFARIQGEVPRAAADRRARLHARLHELLGDAALDPVRLAQEVALMVDRADITEELARLEAHLAQIQALLHATDPSGRRLEFLLQEVHRETNTIGSKAATADIAHQVVDAKSVLERLKEQVQNVE